MTQTQTQTQTQPLPVPFQGHTFDGRRHVRAWRVRVQLRANLVRVDENTINVEIDHATPGGAFRHTDTRYDGVHSRVFYAGRKRVSYKSLRAALPRDVEPPKGLKAGDSFEFEASAPLLIPEFGYSQPGGTCILDTIVRTVEPTHGPTLDPAFLIAWIRDYGITIEFPGPDGKAAAI